MRPIWCAKFDFDAKHAGGWVVVKDSNFSNNEVLGSGGGGMQIVNMGNIVINGCRFDQASMRLLSTP